MIYFDSNGKAYSYEIEDILFSCTEEEWLPYSGKRLNKDYKVTPDGFVDIEPTLGELKEAKRAEINQARDEAEQGGFEYMGKVFDSDIVSCIRIQGAAQSMQAAIMAEEVPTITWTTKDNSTVELTAQELLGLSVSLAEWSNTCHQKATALKAQIDAAETAEELENITWEDKPAILS